ncbi:MAG: hypothetical protein AB7K24_10695 [Gemmataceae bacterium]
MTKNDWLFSSDPLEMLYQFGGEISSRKARLFACACYRRTRICQQTQLYRNAVVFAERCAEIPPRTDEHSESDDDTPEDDGLLLDPPKPAEYLNTDETDEQLPFAVCVLRSESHLAAREAALEAIEDAGARVNFMSGLWHSARESEAAELASLLRDIVGLPGAILAVDPDWLAWQDQTVVRLARAAYDDRELPSGHLDPNRLAVLADALEEAGCTNDDILGHLRTPGPHVRGCWVVDSLLSKV